MVSAGRVVCLLLILLLLPIGAAADQYVGGIPLTTVQGGTVSGDLWFDTDPAPDWGEHNVTKTFTLPAATVAEPGRIAWARLYVSAYCGHMQDAKAFSITNRFDGNGDGVYETTWAEPNTSASYVTLPVAFQYVENGGNDNTALGGGSSDPFKAVNDHMDRVTSDYFMWYNVTSLIQSQIVRVNVDTNGSDDGRIKVITLVVAYDDPASTTVTRYWVNQGHDVCSYYVEDSYGEVAVGSTTFDTAGLSNVTSATLTSAYMASNNGNYGFPTAEQNFDAGTKTGDFTNVGLNRTPDVQGPYSGVASWNVTGSIDGTSDTTLGYARYLPGSGTAAFFKIPLAILTVKSPSSGPVLTTIEVSPETANVAVNATQQFNATAKDQVGDEMTGVAFTWSIGNETVGTVNTTTGLFTALAAGTTTVTASAEGVSGTAAVTASVPACDLQIGGVPSPLGGAVFAREPNTIRITSVKNNGPGTSPEVELELRASDGFVGRTTVPSLASGNKTTITIEDPTIRDLEGGTVTYTAVIDPENAVVETDEDNNVRVGMAKDVKYNGYKGKRYWENGSDVTTVRTYDLRGDIIHSFGNSQYVSGSFGGEGWTNYTVIWTASDLPLPAGASVHDVWLYVPYCWDNTHLAPDNVSIDFNGVRVPCVKWYHDVSNFGYYADFVYGLMTYNVTSLYQTGVNNTALFAREGTDSKISPAGFTLAVVYEDASATRKQIFVNEEFDALGADPSSYGTNMTEATAYVPFSGMTIDTANIVRANLTTFVPWGNDGEGNLFFNGDQIGTGVWNYGPRAVGASDSPQVAVDDREVTAYLNATGNEAAIQGDETWKSPLMVAAQTFLVVEYGNEPGGDTPVASFTANVTSGEAPLAVRFTDLSTNDPTAWAWDFGDNETSNEQNATHTYATAGTYTINLTVANDAGSDSEVKTDYITVTEPVTLPDLTVSTLASNNGEVFSLSENTYTARITNIGEADAGAFAVGFNVSGVTGTVAVDGLAVGANTTVTWTDETVRDAGAAVTIAATADVDGAITESNEDNNVKTLDTTVVDNGYRGKRWTGGSDIETVATYDVRGDLLYSSGDSAYLSATTYPHWTAYAVNWTAGDFAIPANATITAARLYVPYTWDKGPVFPDNVTLAFNDVTVEKVAFYDDEKMWGSSYPYGMSVYDVTGQFGAEGNVALLTSTYPGGGNVSVRGMLLAVVYDDGVTAPHTVVINEGFDLLYGGAGQGTTPEQATAYAPFSAVESGATGAHLITVAPGAGPSEGELIFNDETWTNVWNYTGTSQIGVDERNVTSFLAGSNTAAFQSSADYMEAAAAFLVVSYPVPTGSIAVTSTPAGAAVWLDGTDTGLLAPAVLDDVPAGDHVITLKLDDYADASATVTVQSGETATVDLALTTLTGSLAVTSTPSGAAIFVDGAATGDVTNATLADLGVGEHAVTLKLDGYRDAAANVTVRSDETATLHLDLVEAVGSIAVASSPVGASIFVDGAATGETTNATLANVPAGEHTVTVTKDGYMDATVTVTVVDNETATVTLVMTEPIGSIQVTSSPDGAAIFLDGVDTGEVTNLTLQNVLVGEHEIALVLDGYLDAVTTVTVAGGETATVHLDLAGAALTLHPGWNFVSTPKRLADGQDTIAVFDEVDTADHSVLLYNGTSRWEAMSSQEAFEPLDGIWIYANDTYTIPLHFATGSVQTPPTKDLDAGWNAIGFTDTVPESAANTLISVDDTWTTLFAFDAGEQAYGVSIINGATGRHGDTRTMTPMQGYWLQMTGPGTLYAIGA